MVGIRREGGRRVGTPGLQGLGWVGGDGTLTGSGFIYKRLPRVALGRNPGLYDFQPVGLRAGAGERGEWNGEIGSDDRPHPGPLLQERGKRKREKC